MPSVEPDAAGQSSNPRGLSMVVEGSRLQPEAVVFDCDGILMDSESVWLDMLHWMLSDANVQSVYPEQFLGLSVVDTAKRLIQSVGAFASMATEHLTMQISDRYSELLKAGVPPMPGATELVRELSARMPIAVASNGLRRDVIAMLEHADLLSMVGAVRAIDDVVNGKPAPDLYRAAAEAIGADPTRAVAFEDSPTGAKAAVAAGMTVVGVNADPTIALPTHHRLTDLTGIQVAYG